MASHSKQTDLGAIAGGLRGLGQCEHAHGMLLQPRLSTTNDRSSAGINKTSFDNVWLRRSETMLIKRRGMRRLVMVLVCVCARVCDSDIAADVVEFDDETGSSSIAGL